MKKMLLLILSVPIILSLAACNSSTSQQLSTAEENKNLISSATGVEESTDNRESTVMEQYKVGDIILADGSAVKAADFITIDSRKLPVAVISGLKEDGTTFGVGVHRSDSPLPWEQDGTGEQPAFNFVETYAETYKLTGDYAFDWYMPSIEELKAVYENREDINDSLQKIYELDNQAAMDGLDTNWYWASTQSDSKEDYAWFVHFFNGYAGECPKNFTNVHVLAVREF